MSVFKIFQDYYVFSGKVLDIYFDNRILIIIIHIRE